MVEKFVCKKCGNCCKNFKSSLSKNLEVPSFVRSKGPLIALSKPTLLLQEWEKDLFLKELIVPNYVFFDIKSNRTIILNYTLNTDRCPLLKGDNSCAIYDKRPIICKRFPCPYRTEEDLKVPGKLDNSLICKSELSFDELSKMIGIKIIDKNKDECQINPGTLKKKLYLRYGKAFCIGFLEAILLETVTKFLVQLMRDNKINLVREGYNLRFLIRRINNSEKIDIGDFLKEYGGPELKEIVSEVALAYIGKSFSELE